MFLIRGTAADGCRLVPCNPFGPLCTGSTGITGSIENAGAQKSGDELQFIRGKALYKTAGLGLMRTIGTRNQSGYQGTLHGRSPVGEEPYSFGGSGRIMPKTDRGRKGMPPRSRSSCNQFSLRPRLRSRWVLFYPTAASRKKTPSYDASLPVFVSPDRCCRDRWLRPAQPNFIENR